MKVFLDYLINEINRIEYKNNKFLSIIFHVCSNIACGTLGQVEQLNGQGLLWKAIDIAYHYINQNIFNYDKNQVIYNALYTITQAILGADNEIKTQLIIYQKYLIVSLYYLGLKKYYENKNELSFLTQMGNAIYQLINCGEADLDVEPFSEPSKIKDFLSGKHAFNTNVTEDTNSWINVAFARYYGIKGVRVVGETEKTELTGN